MTKNGVNRSNKINELIIPEVTANTMYLPATVILYGTARHSNLLCLAITNCSKDAAVASDNLSPARCLLVQTNLSVPSYVTYLRTRHNSKDLMSKRANAICVGVER